jgi:hypothetical protein
MVQGAEEYPALKAVEAGPGLLLVGGDEWVASARLTRDNVLAHIG